MKKQSANVFDRQVLDQEEQLIEEALERAEFESVGNLEETKKMLAEAATRHLELNKSKSITARVNQLDLIKLKARAKAKNIPYQTLPGVIIRDYVDGKTDVRL